MTRNIEIDGNFAIILTCAVRYALGRRTYITAVVPQFVKCFLPDMDDKGLYAMRRDIVEHGKHNWKTQNNVNARGLHPEEYGDKCDYDSWMMLLDAVEEEMNKRGIAFE